MKPIIFVTQHLYESIRKVIVFLVHEPLYQTVVVCYTNPGWN